MSDKRVPPDHTKPSWLGLRTIVERTVPELDMVSVGLKAGVGIDKENAAALLRRIVDQMRFSLEHEGRAILSVNLAAYLILAIEQALAQPANLRADALAKGLGLSYKARGRVPRVDPIVVDAALEQSLASGQSISAAIGDVANSLGISEETVKRNRQRAKKAKGS